MKKRKAKIQRKTRETNIVVELVIDGQGKNNISTGVPFLNHMLELFSRHGLFDLKIQAKVCRMANRRNCSSRSTPHGAMAWGLAYQWFKKRSISITADWRHTPTGMAGQSF